MYDLRPVNDKSTVTDTASVAIDDNIPGKRNTALHLFAITRHPSEITLRASMQMLVHRIVFNLSICNESDVDKRL